MLSQKALEIKESVQTMLSETHAALERAETDEDLMVVIATLEEFARLGTSNRIRPLHGVEATLQASRARLERISRTTLPSIPRRYK